MTREYQKDEFLSHTQQTIKGFYGLGGLLPVIVVPYSVVPEGKEPKVGDIVCGGVVAAILSVEQEKMPLLKTDRKITFITMAMDFDYKEEQ